MKRSKSHEIPPPVFFYCTRNAAEPERSKPKSILASIIGQLSCVQPGASLLAPVIKMYKIQGEGFETSGIDLDDSKDLIISMIETYDMATIVIDALDECDPQTRQDLLDTLEVILRESLGLVKIFVSSRDDQDIVDTLRNYPNMEVSSQKNSADTSSCVSTETKRLVENGQLLRHSQSKPEMMNMIITEVSRGADGM